MLIHSPDLAASRRIRHAFFTREGGTSGGLYSSLNGGLGSADDKEAVIENRRRMAAALGVAPASFLSLHQIHSADVVIADAPWKGGERPRADAVVTRTSHLALAIATADCGPVLFADAPAGVVGAAHAGWKGAFGGVLEATLARMEELGARRSAIVATLGPTIGPENYEVGPEFVARFVSASEANRAFFRPSGRPNHALFDLPGYIGNRLHAAGIGRFTALGLCTYGDPGRFYSYRRSTHNEEPDYGRLISSISLAHDVED